MHHKALGQIIQGTVVGLPFFGRFDFDIDPLIAPTPSVAADIPPQQMAFV
jgi:hypothetical protein